jgi:hypothetical protein
MEEDYHEEKEDAKFNMALDTLKRLGKILEEIKQADYNSVIPLELKQAIKIGNVKQFFIQASPLLPNKTITEYKSKILNLKPKNIPQYENDGYSCDKFRGYILVFDNELDYKLNEILIELQQKLQEQKYFMPPAEDEGLF